MDDAAGPGMTSRMRLQLETARDLSASVRHLLFAVDGEPVHYSSGQSLDLYVPSEGQLLRRAYSIACAPNVYLGRKLELAVSRVPDGQASLALHELPPGAVLDAEPPAGYMIRRHPDEPALFIATGSGLSPFRAMLQEELERAHGPKVALLFGCRTSRDILWSEELNGWAERYPRFRLFVSLSRPEAEWSGLRGYVQDHLRQVLKEIQPGRVFICGLSAMTHAVERGLLSEGFPESGILLEEYDS